MSSSPAQRVPVSDILIRSLLATIYGIVAWPSPHRPRTELDIWVPVIMTILWAIIEGYDYLEKKNRM